MGRRKVFRVTEREVGMRLLAFLRAQCGGEVSVKALKRAIDQKGCLVNGKVETFSTFCVRRGDVVELDLARSVKRVAAIELLYEDAHLALCNKPAGVVCDSRYFSPHHLVHRLDKETSGCLILAKSKAVKERMISLFEQGKVSKLYLALVEGVVKKEQGRIENALGRVHGYQGQTIYGAVPTAKGKKAITEWKKLKQGKDWSLVVCRPLTGRTHQLRVHLAGMGHPILGDVQYGCRRAGYPRHLLHAYRLRFPHPMLEKEVSVEAPLPEDFIEILGGASC